MKSSVQKLTNQLPVLTITMPTLESATVTVWVKTGSRNETDKISGISHFLEHMVFKGGKKYKNAKMVSETIDSIGGEFNAGTTKEWTKFYIKARSQKLDIAFDVLSDMLLSPKLAEGDIKREKGVIIEEIGMYEDTPIRHVWDVFERLIFRGHQLGRDVIGTRDTIRNLSKSDVLSYINTYYRSVNMLIAVAGGTDEKTVTELSEKYFNKTQSGKVELDNIYKSCQEKPQSIVIHKSNSQSHIVLGFPGNRMGHPDRFADAVMNTILGGGMSSRLFTEVREKRGLAYAVKSDFERLLDTGYFAVYTGTDPNKAQEAMKVILDQCYGLANRTYKISLKEFSKAKEYLKGHLALALEDTSDVNDFFGIEYLMLGKTRTPEDVYKNIDKVKLEDVYRVADNYFNKDKLNLTVIGPHKNKSVFDKLVS